MFTLPNETSANIISTMSGQISDLGISSFLFFIIAIVLAFYIIRKLIQSALPAGYYLSDDDDDDDDDDDLATYKTSKDPDAEYKHDQAISRRRGIKGR